jgi:hypothetical protein
MVRTQDSFQTPFDNTTVLGSEINEDNAQEAIEKIYSLVTSSSRSFNQFSYGGNANVGRFLEFFPSINLDEAPLRVINNLEIYTIVARTTSTSATCTIGFYDNLTLLYTLTFTANKEVVVNTLPPNPIFTLPASGNLKIKIDSGSIAKPHLYITGQGG